VVDPEGLYRLLPAGLQHVACSLEGWRIRRWRFDAEFWRLLAEAEVRGRWTTEEVQGFRDRRIASFVAHAAETVPYYRGLFRSLGVEPREIRGLADLAGLPVLTKDTVRDRLEEFRSSAVPRREWVHAHTSGTTGGGLRFLTTRTAVREQWAVWWRYRRWHGIPFDAWCGYFGGRLVVPVETARPPFWRYNLPMRQILFSGHHMSEGNLGAYVAELRRRRPPWLHGYPSLLTLLAAFLLDRGTDLGYAVRWVTVGAENLLRHQAELIERAFGVRPRQHYGLAEGVANLSECEGGRLHVDEDFAGVEFLPDEASGACRIVGTNVTNLVMPFIRYDTGDLARPEPGPCPCGRPGRIVSAVDGRQEDYIVLPNGARLGRLDHAFKDLTSVREAQIVQLADGTLRVRLVPRAGFGQQDEMRVVDELRKRVGSQIQIVVELTTTLERGPTGKLRFVVSELTDGSATSVMRGGAPRSA